MPRSSTDGRLRPTTTHAPAASLAQTLVLWDIDRTLVDVGSLSEEVYADAFRSAVGRPMERLADLHGRTDRAITVETLRMHGVTASEALVDAFGAALADTFGAYEAAVRQRGRALPGAREGLAALSLRDGVVQSVLTGNVKPVAVAKLAAFGLHQFVDFEVGAFGMDHQERPPLVRLAQARAARQSGQAFTAANTVLVGDTPSDVLAGHLGGARVVAVATGPSHEGALRDAGAELVLADLSDTRAVVDAVLAATSDPPQERR